MMDDKMVAQEEPDSSWSENTTPASDELYDMSTYEEILRSGPAVRRSGEVDVSRPRFMRAPIRQRIRPQPYEYRVKEQQSYSFPMLDRPQGIIPIEQTSPTVSFVSSETSPVTDQWSSSGFVEEEDGTWEHDEEMTYEEHDESIEHDPEVLLIPKLEPDDEVDMSGIKEESIPQIPSLPNPITGKRPRGRPRKHPKPSLEDKAKIAKGRSKTGCKTCRRRKKKCDERKPHCMNCEKNAVTCEGYREKEVWRSGKEKAQSACITIPALPSFKLSSVIQGVETPGDRVFFEHYLFKLSSILTVEGKEDNAFRGLLLPMALSNPGLMHSILALASTHIDYQSSYGIELLRNHPDADIKSLQLRSQYHHEEAMHALGKSTADHSNAIIPATLGQMLCLVLQTLADPNPCGMHRLHLKSYQRIIRENPPEDSDFVRFIDEFFQYQICADELISLPQSCARIDGLDRWGQSPINAQDNARLLGVNDGLLRYNNQITILRDQIRCNMQNPNCQYPVTYEHLYAAASIDARIREWQPCPEAGSRNLSGQLYKQMLWVYLWRTMYPPQTNNWKIDPKLTEAVDNGISLLASFAPEDRTQTLLLVPTFTLGCAAFEPHQRDAIRKSISVIKAYMGYKNSDTALLVLEEVWRLMDAKDERSWDWQTVAQRMGLDFLIT